jgi:hypothetical protein
MKLDNILLEAEKESKGEAKFDYKFWFWAKKGSSYGIGYARQPTTLDDKKIARDAALSAEELKKLLAKAGQSPEAAKDINLELVSNSAEKGGDVMGGKVLANVKRLESLTHLFDSPIVIHWLSAIKGEEPKKDYAEDEPLPKPAGERPTVLTIPSAKPGDVLDLGGNEVNFVRMFRDRDTRKLARSMAPSLKINDEAGDTINTIVAKFIRDVVSHGKEGSERSYARGEGLMNVMKGLRFTDPKLGVQVVPFEQADYALLPKGATAPGGGNIDTALRELIRTKFGSVIKRARAVF